jgi:hypothetical protein
MEARRNGQPAWPAVGSRNRATLALEALLEGEAEKITRKVVALALKGNVAFYLMRLISQRLLRAPRFADLPPS